MTLAWVLKGWGLALAFSLHHKSGSQMHGGRQILLVHARLLPWCGHTLDKVPGLQIPAIVILRLPVADHLTLTGERPVTRMGTPAAHNHSHWSSLSPHKVARFPMHLHNRGEWEGKERVETFGVPGQIVIKATTLGSPPMKTGAASAPWSYSSRDQDPIHYIRLCRPLLWGDEG